MGAVVHVGRSKKWNEANHPRRFSSRFQWRPHQTKLRIRESRLWCHHRWYQPPTGIWKPRSNLGMSSPKTEKTFFRRNLQTAPTTNYIDTIHPHEKRRYQSTPRRIYPTNLTTFSQHLSPKIIFMIFSTHFRTFIFPIIIFPIFIPTTFFNKLFTYKQHKRETYWG